MSDDARYDVAVVGASLAGCTAATLLAREGARVALLERHADPGFYKVLCTHFIQASATPTLERLGLAEKIEAAGGVRNALEVWSRYGWLRPELGVNYAHPKYGYAIRAPRHVTWATGPQNTVGWYRRKSDAQKRADEFNRA